jgi:uncharacterized protein YqiB (DUF1249 family)
MKQYEQIYKKLYQIAPKLDGVEEGEALKLKSAGYMDLNIDVLYRDEAKNTTTIALSHYYKHHSGDMIADPDMEVKIHHNLKMAEALSYQDSFGYRQVYPKEGFVDPAAKKDLNQFLNQWLNNIKMQGHQVEGDLGTDKGGKGR